MVERKKKIFKKGKSSFILPEKEIKQLAKQGKFSDPLEISKEEKAERRKTEIQNIAQKSVDIETAKEGIREGVKEGVKPAEEEIKADALERSEEIKQGREVVQGLIPPNIETELITITDDAGFTRQIEMPIGTNEKINAANARREGRIPFRELPTYQQFLAGAAVTAVSPTLLTASGKTINTMSKGVTKFMNTKLLGYTGKEWTFGAGIMTWLASDNIIGTMSIYTRDLVDDVTFGKLSKEEALEKIDEGDQFVNTASNFIKGATIIQPLLWPFRNIVLTNIEVAKLAIEENKERIRRA